MSPSKSCPRLMSPSGTSRIGDLVAIASMMTSFFLGIDQFIAELFGTDSKAGLVQISR